jgi:hypothetical protein
MFTEHEDDSSSESMFGAALSLRIVHPIVGPAGRIDRVAVEPAVGGQIYSGSCSGGGIPTGLRTSAPRPVVTLVVITVVAVSADVSVRLSRVLSLVGITSGRSWGAGPLSQGVSPPPR